jgi:predicted RNA-binding Zn ribbon-like protein
MSTIKRVLLVSMSQQSKKFKVPDELASLYDFANSLDVRHFVHQGAQHQQSDELTGPRELGTWMAQRGLIKESAGKIAPAMFDAALRLRTDIRAYLACDPAERRKSDRIADHLSKALASFPLAAAMRDGRLVLQPSRHDAVAGLSYVVAELYDGSIIGTLDRLKMCAAEECRRVFFDRSKPSTRRWCMSTLCGNRMKTRTYRARHRGGE